MKLKNILRTLICITLCACMLMQLAYASAKEEQAEATLVTYVSDVKIIYAKSLSQAKESVPAGYTLYESDINKGTDELGVYLCYATTTELSEAVTDIRVMNENGGFDRGTFNDKMDTALEALDEQAKGVYNAIYNEFVPNLNANLPSAKYAYDQLNIFLYDDGTPLGDYIKDGKLNQQDIAKMMLVCHTTILSSVLSLIAQGLQKPEGEDWLDKLEKMNPEDYEMNAALQKQYADLINKIQPTLNQFSDQYNIMVYTDDVRDSMTAEQVELYGEDLANEDVVKWWNSLWEILNAHPLAGDSGLTAESVLVEWYLGESVANHKICMLIDAMSEGQRALLALVGPINFIVNDVFNEEMRLEAENSMASIKEENGKISLWAGIDTDIFNSEVGITSVAFDEMITSNNYDIFTDEKAVLTVSAEHYISIITNCSSIIFSAISVIKGIALFAKGYTGTAWAIKLLAHIGTFLAKGIVGAFITYAPLVVLGACLLASLIIWIVKEIQAGKPPEHDRTTIPKYMVDSLTDSNGAQRYEIYKRVDNVFSDSKLKKIDDFGLDGVKNMCGADINANKGYHWSALYLIKNEAAGEPIQAGFTVSDTFDISPEGYIPLRHFNKKSEAVNLNAVDEYNGDTDRLYLFYKGERVAENHSVYKYVRSISIVNVTLYEPNNPDKYRFSYSDAFGVAKKELTEMGMFVINHDFSDDPDVVSLIGWSGTDNAEYAIKDIRLVYKSTVGRAAGSLFGSLTYGNMGVINEWSVFVSRGEQNPAPPVTELKITERGDDPSAVEGLAISINDKESTFDTDGKKNYGTGWEAVNEFTGGQAVPLGKVGAQIYFMPETTFTEGDDYLAGIEVDAYITNYHHLGGSYNCCHTDIWDNDYEKYRAYKEENFGELFFDNSSVLTVNDIETRSDFVHEIHNRSDNNPDCPFLKVPVSEMIKPYTTTSVKYTLTKNPYRAIYGVASKASTDLELRNSFMNYAQFGYALCPTEATMAMSSVYVEYFNYMHLYESKRGFEDKTTVIKDNKYRSNGIVVNVDYTQSYFGSKAITWNGLYVMGYCTNRTPLVVEDMMFSSRQLDESEYPDTFLPIPYMGGDGSQYTSLAPFHGSAKLLYMEYAAAVYCELFTSFFGYVRSEIENDDITTSYNPGAGRYVSNIYLSSKEKIRTTTLIYNDKEAECKDITYSQLETQLVNLGATTTYTTNIGTDYYSGGNDNANTIFLGLTRSDNADDAIRDIRFYVCNKGETPERSMTVDVTVDGKVHKVTYTLVDNISITSKANLDCKKVLNGKGIEMWEETELLKERQAYLYVTRNSTAFPAPITDIQITTWCSFGAYEPLLDFEGRSFYTVKKKSSVNLHIKDKWFEEGYSFSFKREGNNDRYISEITIKNGDNENKVVASLIEAGYSVVNKDMNEKAAGDHIYLGVKYTDKKEDAITNLLTLHKSNPYSAYSVTDEAHLYKLCADIDLNKGAAGDYIYLFYTKDARAGEPLVDLYGSGGIKDQSDTLYSHKTVQRLWDFKYSNLNAGTTVFTADVYLVMKREGNTGKYISDVYVAYGWSKSDALEKLKDKGFTEYIDKDLNDGTGSSQYIYLGYKRTDNPDEAIRSLAVMYLKHKSYEHKGMTYTLVSDVNLNRHCSVFSKDLYLYYSKDPKAGEPITSLYCASKPINYKKDSIGYHETVKVLTGYSAGEDGVDLNMLARGDYIYLVTVYNPEPEKTSSIFGNGSWLVIIIFLIFALICVGVVLLSKKKINFITQARDWLKKKF